MKRTPSLDDLTLFLAVADAGGLAGASRATGTSVPTLSRRMTALEAEIGRRLFVRGKRAYALTSDGRALLAEAAPLRTVTQKLQTFASSDAAPRVRITAGMWTSRFLARHLSRVWSPDDAWIPEFLASNANVDIARREADIGIRNRRPEQSWLAGRRTTRIEYGIYATGPDVAGFVTLPDGAASTPSERWLRANHADSIVTTASDARLALDLALAGIGRILLPTFEGDAQPTLHRIGAPIDDISHDEWLVSHHDGRHDPPVRKALDAIGALLEDTALRSPR